MALVGQIVSVSVNPDSLNPPVLNLQPSNPTLLSPKLLNPKLLNPKLLSPKLLNAKLLHPGEEPEIDLGQPKAPDLLLGGAWGGFGAEGFGVFGFKFQVQGHRVYRV